MIFLDTHIWLWWLGDQKQQLSDAQKTSLSAVNSDQPAHIASVSLWEVAMLVAHGRLEIDRPFSNWIRLVTESPLLRLVDLTPAAATALHNLPSNFPNDPADRIIAGTAIAVGGKLLTADGLIRRSGVVEII